MTTGIPHRRRTKIPHSAGMPAVGPELKKLREATRPRLSIRSVAERLDIPASSYAFYESPAQYKKAHLPMDLARKLAGIFAGHGIDAAEVMKLAGLDEEEAAPVAQAIEAQRPPVQHVMMPVALPNEDALAAMFEGLLAIVPEGSTRAEVARILARRLPIGFAAIGPLEPGPSVDPSIAGEAFAPPLATEHHAPEQPLHK